MRKDVLKVMKKSVLVLLVIALFGMNVCAQENISGEPSGNITEENIQEENSDKIIEEQQKSNNSISNTDALNQENKALNEAGESVAEEYNNEQKAEENSTAISEDSLKVEFRSSDEYKIILSETAIPAGTKSVKIPVWSKINEQDDIKWYDAQQQSDGSYTAILKLSNHKGLGEYCIHAYAVMNDGQYVYVAATSLTIEEPKIANISITNYNIDKGTFRVMLSGITDGDMIKRIAVPIWSKANGQDDINWYEAKKNSSGEYFVDVNIKNHKYSMGTYYVHVYITDITDCEFFAGSTNHEVAIDKGNLIITKNSEKEYTIQLQNVKVPGGISQIQFPTWSAVNGQDDIKWYTATKVNDGSYRYKISVTDHKGLGQFFVHAYGKMPDGSLVYIGNTSFEIEAPSVGTVKATITNKENGQFQVRVSGIENGSLIKKIQIPIWSASDQNDIVWYTATKDNNGDYVVNVSISKHKYNCGDYFVHVYMTDITGCQQFVGSTTCAMTPEYGELTVKDINGTESSFRVELTGVKIPAGVKNIQFAVWGNSNGQNDLRWYTATRQADGSYIYDVKIANHKELGRYNVHAYCTTKGDSQQFIGATGFEVATMPTVAQVEVSDINGTTGTFKVTVSGVIAPSGVEKVQIPIWCANDQSDIVWYTATKTSEGVYTVTAKVLNHGHHFGTYKVHVYVTMGNGIQALVGSTSASIQAINYVYNISLSSTQREVGIMGATNVSRVQFPTWSNTNGQDDIVWYEGTNRGGGKWNAVVDTTKHKNGGVFTTHVYVTTGSQSSYVGSTSYSLTKVATAQSIMSAKANMYSSSTGYLILVNRSTHKVGVFQGRQGSWNCIQYWDCSDGAPSTPTVEGTFRVGSRGYYFDSGSSRCYWYTQFYGNYLFHSVLYSKYNGNLVDGRLGMALSHGCVRLHINNAKWIYDTIPSGSTVVVYH